LVVGQRLKITHPSLTSCWPGPIPNTVFDPTGLLDELKKGLVVRNKAVHLALGVRANGTKETLGVWLEQKEGAKFWLRVMNELKNRSVEDVLIAVVDGLRDCQEFRARLGAFGL
jgi:Transposase, Mutator family